MNNARKTENRLRDILAQTASKRPANLDEIIKSDIANVLKNYIEIAEMAVQITQKGEGAVVHIVAKADSIKTINYLR